MSWKLSDRSKRNLRGVHPDLVRVVMRALEISPLDFVVIEGLRSRERQAELVKSGAKLEDAYFAVHHAELMAQTASAAKNATLASVAAKGSRPAEAAASSATPTPAKVDYSKMPRADFMKLWNS